MHIVDNKIQERARTNNPINISIIGAGEMGKGLMNQIIRYVKGIRIVVVYNRTLHKAENALATAGVKEFKVANSHKDLQYAFNYNIIGLTTQPEIAVEFEKVDVVVEMTGQILFGLTTILRAFEKGKHVVSFNAELESTFGPLIRQEAINAGVRYTLGDGDQPGCTMNLYRYVKAMGFTPLVCGSIKSIQDHYRTPATQAAFAKEWDMNPIMATNFVDGTKISLEQACVANATGMVVSERGMKGYSYDGIIDDVAKMFDIDELIALGGVVDYALGATPKPGVFVFASANDALSNKYLTYGKLGEGPLYSFYVPYHLLFFEFVFSIVRLVDFNDVTIDAAHGLKVEVGTIAKHDMEPGTILDGIGGFHAYGLCENHDVFQQQNLLPIGLSENMILKRKIKKNVAISFSDVETGSDHLKIDYYQKQLKL